MNTQEFRKRIWKQASLKEKLLLSIYGIYFEIQHYFRKITKICPHDSTLGSVYGKNVVCLDCLKVIKNPDYGH